MVQWFCRVTWGEAAKLSLVAQHRVQAQAWAGSLL
jgi:hypothetical protein